ncbi:hypothetical protein GIB67_004965, partial [Kingdonia uniflora]
AFKQTVKAHFIAYSNISKPSQPQKKAPQRSPRDKPSTQTELRERISILQQTSFDHIYIQSKYDKTDSQLTRQNFDNGLAS